MNRANSVTKDGQRAVDLPAAARRRSGALAAILLPLLVSVLQRLLWPSISPFAWLLFLPAVLLTAWIGGYRSAALATLLSTALVWFLFLPPAGTFNKEEPRYFLSAGMFITVALVSGGFASRLRSASQQTADALADARRANESLEHALKERRIFEALIENSSDFIGIADPTGHPIYVNPAGRRMIGLADDIPVGTVSILDCYTPDQRAFASDVILKTMLEKGRWQGETSFRHFQTEAAIPVSDTHFMIRERENGEIIGMGTVTRDISELKRAREEAEASRLRLAHELKAAAHLQRIATKFVREGDLHAVLDDVVETAMSITHADMGNLQLFDPVTKHLKIVAQRGFSQPWLDFFGSVEESSAAACASALQRSERVIVDDVASSPIFSGTPALQVQLREGVRAVQSTPVIGEGGMLLGMLSTHYRARRRPDERDLALLDLLVSQVAEMIQRSEAEKSLQESEARLKRAQEIAHVGGWELNLVTGVGFWSDEMYRIFGIPPAELGPSYEAFLELIHPDDRAALNEAYTGSVREGRDRYEVEYRHIRPSSGEVRTAYARYENVRNESGKIVRTIGTVQDITERKQIEQTLRESEERFRLAMEEAPIGMTLTDLDRRFIRVNQALCDIVGYTPEELMRMSARDITHPDDVGLDLEEQGKAVRREVPRYRREKRYIRKDGSTVDVVVNGSVVRDREGQPLYFIAEIEDITERKRAQEALKASEERFRLTIDEAPIGMALVGLDGRFARVNRALCDIAGYSVEELTKRTFQDITHPDDLGADLALMRQLSAGEIPRYQLEKRYIRKDGCIVNVMLTASALRDRAGRPLYFIAQVEDITERKRAQQALKTSEERLRGTLDHMLEGCMIIGCDWTYRYINPAAAEQGQQQVDRLLGHTMLDMYPGIEKSEVFDKYKRCMEARVADRFESPYLFPDGTTRWYLFSVEPVPEGLFVLSLDITRSKEAERALKESEARFRDLVELAPDALFIANRDARFLDVNSAACALLGYTHDELVAKTIIDIIPPADVPRLLAARELLSAPGQVQVAEWTQLRKTGEPVPVEVSSKILPDGRWIAFARDIGERKRAEEAVRLSETKYAGIISLSEDAIISIGEDQRITLFNQGAEKIFGYSQQEVVGAPHDLLLPERFRQLHRRRVEGFAAGGVVARRMGERPEQIFGRRKNGEEFPADASISKLEVGGQRLLTVVLRDMTEQRRTEREQRFLADVGAILTSSLDFNETLTLLARRAVKDIADMCVIDGPDESGQFRNIAVVHADPARSDAIQRLVRLAKDRWQLSFVSSVIEANRAMVWTDVTAELLGSVAKSPEWLDVHRELATRSAIAAPLRAGEKLQGAILFTSDRSGRYGARDLALMEELAGRIGLAIENARLYQEARRATQARDDVLGIVAHDLRNPLGAIRLASSVLEHQLSREASGRGLKSVESINRALRRSQRLIDDLLDVTRVEAGKLSVKQEPVHAQQLVYDVVEGQQLLASSNAIELRIEAEEHLPDLRGDHDRLLQVMENLIGNAVRFTPQGGRITVGAKAQAGEVLFSVTNTGAGIPPEHLPHLFERFWRARRDERSGAGLGLPICKGIVEAHGGRIWAESTLHQSATFYFTIPAIPGAREQPREGAPTLH